MKPPPFEYGPTLIGMATKPPTPMELIIVATIGVPVLLPMMVDMVGLKVRVIIGHGLGTCLAIGELDSIVSSKIPMLNDPYIVEELQRRI